MLVEDPDYLAYVRTRPCSVCGRRGPSEPHHIKPKGHGGGSRLDVPVNLIPLCAGCHRAHQEGRANQIKCWQIVAERNGLPGWEACEEAVHRLLRTKP